MKEIRTIGGKHDARCRRCFRAAYSLWVDDGPPPTGCAEGQDHDISRCGHVYSSLVSIVIARDHIHRELQPYEVFLLNELGSRADEIMAGIRAHKPPPGNQPLEPKYDGSHGDH